MLPGDGGRHTFSAPSRSENQPGTPRAGRLKILGARNCSGVKRGREICQSCQGCRGSGGPVCVRGRGAIGGMHAVLADTASLSLELS